jgi:hypothetical protein
MIAVIPISIVLSILGYLYYHFALRDSLQPRQSRFAIHLIIFASLLIPLTVGQMIQPPQPGQVGYRATTSSLGHQCSADEMELCQKRWASGEFCNCDEISRSKIIAYEANGFYDFFLTQGDKLKLGFQLAGLVLGFFLLMRLALLIRLILISEKRKIKFKSGTLILLYHPSVTQVASFRLFRKYILWSEPLALLPEEEQTAILEHEWSHLQQGNTFEQIALSVLQIFWFANPVWYAFKKELNKLSELIADEAALRILPPTAYSKLLLKLRQQPAFLMVQSFAQSLINRGKIDFSFSRTRFTVQQPDAGLPFDHRFC